MGVLRRWRWPLIGGLGLLGLVVAAWAFDAARGTVIADGVHAGSVKLGGLAPSAAQRRLAVVIGRHEHERIQVVAGDQKLTVVPAKLGITLDVHGMAAQAVDIDQGGSFISRDLKAISGSSSHVGIDPQLTAGSAPGLQHVAAQLNRKPRDAVVAAGPAGLQVVPDQSGIVVRADALSQALGVALLLGHKKAVVSAQQLPAAVRTADLRRRYPSYVTIDRGHFTLRVYQHLRLTHSYPIAVGMQGLETPAGLYHIQNKAVDPAWDVPNSSWAGSLAGHHIPPGPDDPLKARWMGLFNGAGIHGTDETDSIGSDASHGCVRMLIPDVIDLYDRVQVGTPVYIGD